MEPTEEPAPEPTPEPVVESKASFVYPDDWNIALTPDSNQAMIEAVQQKLVELKWLQSNHFTAGSLDDATIQAVIAFQTYCNDALGSALIPCAVENPSIGSDTLLLLMNPTETEALVAPNH